MATKSLCSLAFEDYGTFYLSIIWIKASVLSVVYSIQKLDYKYPCSIGSSLTSVIKEKLQIIFVEVS